MNQKLCKQLVELLLSNNITIATAESCTGGLLSKYITDQAGVSAVFECGVVSYSGRIKHQILGVSEQTIRNFGEVSSETALEMASGIRAVAGSDIGIGITGIAGPSGGTAEKPVGLVYFAVSYKDSCQSVRLELFDLNSREEVRERTVSEVLQYAIDLIQ